MKGYIIILLLFCGDNFNGKKIAATNTVVTIPADTISSDDPNVQVVNGLCYYRCGPFSGYVKEEYDGHVVKRMSSWFNGKLEGATSIYYPNGQLWQERCYHKNKCSGTHSGWWENGIKKFEFHYNMDKREGEFQQWYRSGTKYTHLHFKNDVEDGMQQAWRENGKLYLNYEVKNGYRYGLQKSALCYTLVDEKIKKN